MQTYTDFVAFNMKTTPIVIIYSYTLCKTYYYVYVINVLYVAKNDKETKKRHKVNYFNWLIIIIIYSSLTKN